MSSQLETMSVKLRALTDDMSAGTVDMVIAVLAFVSANVTLAVAFWMLRTVSRLLVRVALGGGGSADKGRKGRSSVVAEVAGSAWMNAAGITHPDQA